MTVKNLRLFGDVEQEIVFDSSKNVAVLLGDNGAGKTTLLYGCTVLLSQFYEHFPECSKKQFVAEDIRNVSNEKKADYLHVGMELEPSKTDVNEYMEPYPEEISKEAERNYIEYKETLENTRRLAKVNPDAYIGDLAKILSKLDPSQKDLNHNEES